MKIDILLYDIDTVSVRTNKYEEFIDTLKQFKPEYTYDDITYYLPSNIYDIELLEKAIKKMDENVNTI